MPRGYGLRLSVAPFGAILDGSCLSSSIRRALVAKGWSKKTARQHARERNADLRELYLHNLSDFQSYHLVYVDESGCDKRAGFRRTGWSPLGVAPLQVSQFHRDQRYQILPAYAQDGIVLSRVFRGSTDAIVFEDFLAQLLQHCGRWPDPKSVVVMDNASFHYSERISQMHVLAAFPKAFNFLQQGVLLPCRFSNCMLLVRNCILSKTSHFVVYCVKQLLDSAGSILHHCHWTKVTSSCIQVVERVESRRLTLMLTGSPKNRLIGHCSGYGIRLMYLSVLQIG